MSSISIVILNWNGKHFLEKFLPGVIANSSVHGHIVETIIADNGSNDGSVDWLLKVYPDVKVIPFAKNHGFTGGYNLALEQIESDYYILLNSDIQVSAGWLEPLVSFMEVSPDAAACMPKMLSFSEPNRFEYAGASGGFVDVLGYPFCRGRILNVTEVDNGQYDDIHEIFWATGACMMVRSKAYWSVGGLDDDFFAHMEEIDLCWRLKSAGFSIWVVPESKVYHVGGGTLPNNNPRKVYLNHRNNLMMLLKNLSKRSLIPVLAFRFLLDLASALVYALSGKSNFSLSVFRAHARFILNFIKTVKKRRKSRISKVKLYPRIILFDFFVMKRKLFSNLS